MASDGAGGSVLDNYLLGENRFLTPQLLSAEGDPRMLTINYFGNI